MDGCLRIHACASGLNAFCEYGIAADFQPTASDWSMMQARLSELENRLANSPRATEQHILSPISGPLLEQGSTPGATFCDSIDTHSIESNSINSSSRSIGFTPAYSTVEHPGLASETRFPASMFLDVDCYVWSHARLPVPSGFIPAPVLALLSQGNVVLDVSQSYFATIHTWFPMISKKRMDMGLPVQNAGPDLAMLFLGMKLVTTPAIDITDSSLYDTAKSFLASLESNGVVSLLCLQAMILVALYEYSHAIHPAAWMTIGSCARYSDILGITPGDYSPLGQVTTWTEAEERRRVWWSIYILDKLVSLGSRKRCLLPDVQPPCKLPVDDDAWDRGEVNVAVSHSTSISYQIQQSAFARLCQASMYLARAIIYAQDKSTMTSSRIEEIMSLAGELSAFATVVDNESAALGPERRLTLLSPQCVARSALFVALDRFTCPEKISAEPGYIESPGDKTQNEIELQRQSMRIIEQASEQLHSLGMELLPAFTIKGISSISKVSPFILDSIYAGAATFHWLLGEGGNEVYRTASADLDMLLDTMSSRWRLGRTMSVRRSTIIPNKPTLTEKNLPDQSGKVFLITGASGGLGKELASILYQKNGKIYMAARSQSKTGQIIRDIQAAHPNSTGNMIFLPLVVDDLTAIKASAQEFLSQESRLDVLYNNAGVMVPPQGSKTVQGYELQIGVNNLAPFLFTRFLHPILAATAQIAPKNSVRVIWVSSNAADGAPTPAIDFTNMDYYKEEGIWPKTAGEGIISIALNPGNFVTNLQQNMPRMQLAIFKLIAHAPRNGAYTQLLASHSPTITEKENGCWASPFGKVEPCRKDLLDPDLGKKYWEWTEEQVDKYK
ncbi:hypothetical protein FPHYL_5674 [Fusarium phyllophilum]|uniref:Xylanolytic transcriptional activator regulatory domain-containing protein n=1 Tax=Fusarium phyllophilum TaxID=47803 RepID=A0A8H5NFB4_9HYPO|nr:hypothetical protein FPHYL_5674 [Fusarium phyllophilum]